MVRTPDQWSAEPAGPPRPLARSVVMPIRVFEMPDRDVILHWDLSRAERFLKAFTKAVATAKEREKEKEAQQPPEE